jgi:hypothetical protein
VNSRAINFDVRHLAQLNARFHERAGTIVSRRSYRSTAFEAVPSASLIPLSRAIPTVDLEDYR